MFIKTLIMAASLGMAAIAPAMAGELKPAQSHRINLGGVAGDAYYTVRQDGYHVVATFTQRGGSLTPVRFQAVLSPGQSVTFSTPRGVGEQPVSMSIKRQGERVIVDEAIVTN
jgi:hypothetical protein